MELAFTHTGQPHRLPLGRDFAAPAGETYRDTPVATLRELIAQIEAGRPWREAVAARYAQQQSWLYRIITDPNRDLFFRQYPPAVGSRVLDIGAGWGQLALPLARHCQVCALEPTAERLDFIRAAAAQDGVSRALWFVQSDFLHIDFETRFDLVLCIGVLEWVPKFAPDLEPIEAQRRFLRRARAALAPGGRLVIGIENRLGLKYLLGAPDDHIGHAGVSILPYKLADRRWRAISGQPLRALTHTRADLDTLLAETGFGHREFFGAFPDYKLPSAIVPLGQATEAHAASAFIPEHEGVTGAPLPNQAELQGLYQDLAHLGVASAFVPSFMVAASD